METTKKLFNQTPNLEERLQKTVTELRKLNDNLVTARINNGMSRETSTKELIKFFHSIDDDLKTNETFLKNLLKTDKSTYSFLLKELTSKNMPYDFIEKISHYAFELDYYLISKIPHEMQTKEMALIAVSKSTELFAYLKTDFREDREIVDKVLSINGEAIQYTNLRTENDIFLKAVRNNGLALKYANEDQLDNWEILSTAYLNNTSAINYLNDDWISYPDKLIALDFTKFILLLAKALFTPTEIVDKINYNLLSNKSKELALKAEQQFNYINKPFFQ
jgi:hypothetical protein